MYKFKFRWKYAVSTFLVCGVLSLTLGKGAKPDSLVVEANLLVQRYDRLFTSRLVLRDLYDALKTVQTPITVGGKKASNLGEGLLFYVNQSTQPECTDFLKGINQKAKAGKNQEEKKGITPADLNSFSGTLQIGVGQMYCDLPEVKRVKSLDGACHRNSKDSQLMQMMAPDVRILSLNDKSYLQLVHDTWLFGQKIGAESFGRAAEAKELYLEKNPKNVAVAKAALIYLKLQERLYSNRMRVAHQGGRGIASASGKETGSRAFRPSDLDYLNIRLNPVTALYIYGTKDLGRRYNLRHVKNPKTGVYDSVELFLSDYEKQMAEYSAIAKPSDKFGYLKLVQFAAILEGMSNRWAIRRLQANQGYIDNSVVASCGPDLVSFRLPDNATKVSEYSAYDALWQMDRQGDLISLSTEKVIAASRKHPLLSRDQVGEVIRKYLFTLSSFKKNVLPRYAGSTPEKLQSELTNQFSDNANEYEDQTFTTTVTLPVQKGEAAKEFNPAGEVFERLSYPGDDLSHPAVAQRYAEGAFLSRKLYLAEGIRLYLAQEVFTKAPTSNIAPASDSDIDMSDYPSPSSATAVAKSVPAALPSPKPKYPETLTKAADIEILKFIDEETENTKKAWLASQEQSVIQALTEALGPMSADGENKNVDLGYTKNQNGIRFENFLIDLEPIASKGVRGMRLVNTARALTAKLSKSAAQPSPGIPTTKYKDQAAAISSPKPELYLGKYPFRNLAAKAGVADMLLPETPDQLSQFFRKKLLLLATYKDTYEKPFEPETAKKILESSLTMKAMDVFFAEVATQFKERTKKLPETETCTNLALPIVARIAGKVPSARETTDRCKDPNRKASAALISALNESLLPALKTTLEKVGKEINNGREEAVKRENEQDIRTELTRLGRIAKQDNLSVARANTLLSQKIAEAERKSSIPSVYEHDQVATLFAEAVSILGLGRDGLNIKTFIFSKSNWYLPGQMNSFRGTEYLLRQLQPKSTLLERMFSTLTDQEALGQVFVEEALSKAPILAIQATWNPKKEDEEPVLLKRLLGAWTVKGGWNEKFFRATVKWTLDSAGRNDAGKVESFCKADLQNYGKNDQFRLMFGAVTGIRGALNGLPGASVWEKEILKDVRLPATAFVEDYIQPYSMTIGVPMLILFAWSFVIPVGLSILGAAGFSGAAGATAWMAATSTGIMGTLGTFGTAVALILNGWASPVQFMFLFQTAMMLFNTHIFLPVQMGYTYQVANSRVENMRTGQFSNKVMVDREKMSLAYEEMVGHPIAETFEIVMTTTQLGYMSKGLRSTLGVVGRIHANRLMADSAIELGEGVFKKSLSDLVKEKGSWKAGMKEYLSQIDLATVLTARPSVVKSGENVLSGLTKIASEKFASLFKNSDEFIEVLKGFKEEQSDILRAFDASITGDGRFAKVYEDLNKLPELQKKVLAAMTDYKDAIDRGLPPIVISEKQDIFDIVLKTRDKILSPSSTDAERFRALFEYRLIRDQARREEARFAELIEKCERAAGLDKTPLSVKGLIGDPHHTFAGDSKTVSEVYQALSSEDHAFLRHKLASDGIIAKNYTRYLGRYIGKFGRKSKILSPEKRAALDQMYSDLDYLMQDYKVSNPHNKAEGPFHLYGKPVFYDEDQKVGEMNIDDFDENPGDYIVYDINEVFTVSSDGTIIPRSAKIIKVPRKTVIPVSDDVTTIHLDSKRGFGKYKSYKTTTDPKVNPKAKAPDCEGPGCHFSSEKQTGT